MDRRKGKKLSLSTETLRYLSDPQLYAVAGAASKAETCPAVCTNTNICSDCRPCL